MLQVTNLSKSFDKKVILNNISLHIPNGSLVCLLGPSGSGKTTLIRLLIGGIIPDKGEIFIDGTKMPNREMMSKIGFMPQSDALYDDLSALDNLYFFGRLYDMEKDMLRKRAEEVLQMVDLINDTHKLVRKFSGGMKKRLSLAIASLNQPKMMFLDEPTVGIDPMLRRSIWHKFSEFRSAGCTLIVTTHIMDEIWECDLAALILEGKLIGFDKVEVLLSQTKNNRIEELFLKKEDIL